MSYAVAQGERGPIASAVRIAGPIAVGRAAGAGQLDYLAIVAFLPLAVFLALHWTAPLAIFAIYAVASILCFFAYGADKRAATNGTWRTPEASLLLLGLVGGWPGAIIGMRAFRHKTRKTSFRVAFWGTVVVNVIALVALTSPVFRNALTWVFGEMLPWLSSHANR